MRESVDAKARRYLGEGRLTVTRVEVDRALAHARCVGSDGAVYDLGVSPAGWFCSCPCFQRCSHVAALELVAPRLDDDEPGPDLTEPGPDFRACSERDGEVIAARHELPPRSGFSQIGPGDPWPADFF